MKWFVFAGVVLLALLRPCSSISTVKNVLIVDTVGSPSHQVWMHRFSKGVAAHGYNTTILTYTMVQNPPENLHVYQVKNLYDMEGAEDYNALDMSDMGPWETFFMYSGWYDLMDTFAMESDALKAVMSFPSEFKFDLIIFDYLGPLSYLVLVDRFPEARVMGATAYPAIEYSNKFTNAPSFFSFEPNFFMASVEDSFCSRLESFLLYTLVHFKEEYAFFPQSEKIVRQYYKVNPYQSWPRK